MGQSKSKSKHSYDVSPTVSEKGVKSKVKPEEKGADVTPEAAVAPVAVEKLVIEVKEDAVIPQQQQQEVQPTVLQVSSEEVATVNVNEGKLEVTKISTTITDATDSVTAVATYDAAPTAAPAATGTDLRTAPAWVTEELFIDILKEHVDNFDRIKEFKAYPALNVGENYATLMLRVSIDVELKDRTEKNVRFMLKVAHENEMMLQMLEQVNFFLPERAMYFDVLPELVEMYKNVGVNIVFAPTPYKFIKDPKRHNVLLEDLGPHGFKNANRLECLNMEHTKCVLKKMAQLHAASAVRLATKGEYCEILVKGVYGDNAGEAMKPVFDSFRDAFLEASNLYENGHLYGEAMSNFFDNITDGFKYASKYNPNEFNVITHGDCWSNNILFRYTEDGRVQDTYFVDFQQSKIGPPVNDLLYFIMSSTQIDIKLKQFDHFIRFYYDNLIENLKLLKYPKELPALRQLHMDLFKYGNWAVASTIITLPIVLLDPTEAADIANFLSVEESGAHFKKLLYTNKRYIRHANEILPWLYNRGLMEVINYSALFPEQSIVKIPDWLTAEYFEDILKEHVKGFKHIKKFQVKPATNAGDNYVSDLLEVNIDVELEDNNSETLSYMFKIASEDSKKLAFMNDTFEKELSMYNILPKLEAFYTANGVTVSIAPKRLKLTKDENCDKILLENLRLLGYKNADRLASLDMKHTEEALTKLAQLHAAGAYYIATGGGIPAVFRRSHYSEEARDIRISDVKIQHEIYMDCLKTLKGSEEYADKIDISGFVDAMIHANKIDENRFNVLNHGDCWTNNILFKYDDNGEIKDLLLIDYQMAKYGSPVQDLLYFIFSSVSLDIKLEEFDYLIRFYHEHLTANLKLLNYPKHIPTLKELNLVIFENGAWAFWTTFFVMPVVLLDTTEKANLKKIVAVDEEGIKLKRRMYTNDKYRKQIEVILPWLNKRGLLDFAHSQSRNALPPINIPAWIDENHFKNILNVDLKDFSKIISFKVESASKAGENWTSVLLRILIEVELKDGSTISKSYILKIPHAADVSNEESADYLVDIFTKENSMYNTYIPKIEKLLNQAGCVTKIAPKNYKFKQEVNCDYVLLEDLTASAFKLANRFDGMDMEHTKCVLQKLAQFHAASVKSIEQKGPYPKLFNIGYYSEENREMIEYMTNGSNEVFLECLRNYKGSELYAQKLRNILKTNFTDRAIEANKVDPNGFNVLNHGDCWINNIMFRYDTADNLCETIFLDYQNPKYGTPAHDLYDFLLSSTALEHKVEKFDYFIRYYHDQLCGYLDLLQYNGKLPSLKELHTDLLKHGIMGLCAINGIACMCFFDSTAETSIKDFLGETTDAVNLNRALYTNDIYKKHAEVVLPWLAKRGLLDV